MPRMALAVEFDAAFPTALLPDEDIDGPPGIIAALSDMSTARAALCEDPGTDVDG